MIEPTTSTTQRSARQVSFLHRTYTRRIFGGVFACAAIIGGTGFAAAGAQVATTDCGAAPAGMNVIISNDAVIVGTNGDDFICAGPGDNTINGRDGNDVIYAGEGNDLVFGRGGDDEIYGGSGFDNLRGGAGADVIDGNDGNDFIRGGAGSDQLAGSDGHDRIDGGSGADLITGGNGNDVLKGKRHNDVIDGGAGNDRIVGNTGADELSGGTGNDKIKGRAGADHIWGGEGFDRVNGGPAHDVCLGAEDHRECEEAPAAETRQEFNFPENEAPVLTVDANGYSVDENDTPGAPLAGVTPSAVDPNGNDLMFSVSGPGSAWFEIHETTGALKVRFSEATLDHESVPSYSLDIEVTDGDLSDSATVTVLVDNVNEAPEFSAEQDDFSIAENSPAGTVLDGSTPVATDPDGDAVSYAIVDGTGQGFFDIDSETGVLTVATSESVIDFESSSSYTLTVEASDGNRAATINMVITVDDVNETPVLIVESTDFSINESALPGDLVDGGEIEAVDTDATDSITWRIVGDNHRDVFGIDATTGQLFIDDPDGHLGNHNDYTITIAAIDNGGLMDMVTVVVEVLPA